LTSNRQWTPVAGLPKASAVDVKLDAGGNQLWAAVEGFGVYATLARRRLRDPRVASAAAPMTRAGAPGSLLRVLGTRVQSARACRSWRRDWGVWIQAGRRAWRHRLRIHPKSLRQSVCIWIACRWK